MSKLFIIPFLSFSLICNAQTDSLNLAVNNLKQIVAGNYISQGMHAMDITVYNSGLVIKSDGDVINFLYSSPWEYKKKGADYPRLYIKDEIKGVTHGYVIKFGLKNDQTTPLGGKKSKKPNALEDFLSNLAIASRYHVRLTENLEDSLQAFAAATKAFPYDSSAVQMNETQRKLMVQGNLLYKKQEYLAAMDKLYEIIMQNPLNYPAGYSNLAYTYAALKNYKLAIFNMKKYLLLYPDAPDARAAQDKIYEWELML